MNRPLIECISLTKKFAGRRQTVSAVTDVNLQIDAKEIVLIKGRSGAGKSTLLNLMSGLLRPTSGSVRIGDVFINELDNNAISTMLLNQVGIIFQNFNLLPTYSVYENIEVALVPNGTGRKMLKKRIMPLLDQFRLTEKSNMLPSELSIGQQQKVAIIRTLAKQPSIIFADEPTGSVDNETALEILHHLKYLNEKNDVTLIIATHGSVPDSFADRVIRIENGRIVS